MVRMPRCKGYNTIDTCIDASRGVNVPLSFPAVEGLEDALLLAGRGSMPLIAFSKSRVPVKPVGLCAQGSLIRSSLRYHARRGRFIACSGCDIGDFGFTGGRGFNLMDAISFSEDESIIQYGISRLSVE